MRTYDKDGQLKVNPDVDELETLVAEQTEALESTLGTRILHELRQIRMHLELVTGANFREYEED